MRYARRGLRGLRSASGCLHERDLRSLGQNRRLGRFIGSLRLEHAGFRLFPNSSQILSLALSFHGQLLGFQRFRASG